MNVPNGDVSRIIFSFLHLIDGASANPSMFLFYWIKLSEVFLCTWGIPHLALAL